MYNFTYKMKSIAYKFKHPNYNKNRNGKWRNNYHALHHMAYKILYRMRFKESRYTFAYVHILPGFKIPLGSKTDLICFCRLRDFSEKAMSIYSFCTQPIPCSPESVPPNLTQSANISRIPVGRVFFHTSSFISPLIIFT